MNYKEIETEFFGTFQKHIIIENSDGSFKSFPADKQNPEYLAFLEITAKPAKLAKDKPIAEPEAPEAE
jgi:hypothetical protein